MLELARILQEHIRGRLKHMLEVTLADIRKLEYVHDSNAQRIFLSGKLAAYEELMQVINDNANTGA